MSVAVAVQSLEKQFGNFHALRGVSLDVQPDELVALLGPSGSGKTTLLRLIAGLDAQDRGRVLFDNADAERLSLRDRRIGFVFQNYALFRHMSIAANIAFGLRARPRRFRPPETEIGKRVGELLDLVQLNGLEERFPSQLSGGQRQRVALAIEPRVLLLDEPFGALDAQVRKDLRRWLRELHDRTGDTTLFVTHDQEEALELADRVAILNRGLIEQAGAPDDVYDRPASAFVCEFLGETNKLPVKISAGRAFFESRPIYAAHDFNAPGPATLYVRPHHVRLAAPDLPGLSGIVSLIRRNGAIRRAEVTIAGLAKRFDVDLASQIAPALGERVGLQVTQGHLFRVT